MKSEQELEADYFVIGAGAMGMAFADEILTADREARVVIADRRARPGGHWNDAYDFVSLHQPALYYGVNSMPLGSGGRDLVSKAQILAYYELVQKRLEATGRFTFLPQCEVRADGQVTSLAANDVPISVKARKTVDATHMDVQVPANTPPGFSVAEPAQIVPLNALASLEHPFVRYVVIGAGKTGMDAALHLLGLGVDAAAITWIMPNDAWFLNRDALQPDGVADEFVTQFRIISSSESLSQILERIEGAGRLLRMDAKVQPTKYRCATVTEDELVELRRIGDIERSGRVQRIDGAHMVLAEGERTFAESPDQILYINCTADGLAQRPSRPIYSSDRITLQPVSMCQQVMSAAAIAALECRVSDDARKNATFVPVPHPVVPADYLRAVSTTFRNQTRAGAFMGWWLATRRLSGGSHMSWFDTARFLFAAFRYPVPDEQKIEAMIAAG